MLATKELAEEGGILQGDSKYSYGKDGRAIRAVLDIPLRAGVLYGIRWISYMESKGREQYYNKRKKIMSVVFFHVYMYIV